MKKTKAQREASGRNAAVARAAKKAKRNVTLAPDGHIRCGSCGEAKPLVEFSPSIANQGYGRCRRCALAAGDAARARDPERFRAYSRAHREKHPEAMRAAVKKWEARKRAEYDANPPTDGTIRCSACKNVKNISAFSPSVVAKGCGVCRACKVIAHREYAHRHPEKVNAAQRASRAKRDPAALSSVRREHYRKHPDMYRGYALNRNYGITPAEYECLLAAQGGGCACCGATANRSGKRLFVDHDHETGAVRGIICHKCNIGIAVLGDTIDGLRRAIAYLERAPQPRRIAPMRINLLKGENHGVAA